MSSVRAAKKQNMLPRIAMLSVVITEPGWCSGESTQPPTNVAWIQILM